MLALQRDDLSSPPGGHIDDDIVLGHVNFDRCHGYALTGQTYIHVNAFGEKADAPSE